MMHKKALLFNAPKIAKDIMRLYNPQKIKEKGKDMNEIQLNNNSPLYTEINIRYSDIEYKRLCKNKQFNLGDVLLFKEKGKIIADCGTQYYYGRFLKMDNDSIEKRSEAIEMCLVKIYNKAKLENLSVAIPKIGRGRARSDWNRVRNIVKKVFHDSPISIYFIPDKYLK